MTDQPSKKDLERRRSSRIQRRATIQFESGGEVSAGVVLNLSEMGLLVRSKRLLEPGSLIRIPLSLGGGQEADLHGRVIWSRKLPMEENGETWVAMGVELGAAPAPYLRFIEGMRRHRESGSRAVEERFEVYHRVRFNTGEAFLTEYTENLSRGGMYLTTGRPFASGTLIKAQLDIPGIEEPIEVEGKVAYCLDASHAEELGRAPGVGVQFVDLSPEGRARLHHYIRRLEVHRSRPERRHTEDVPVSGFLSEFLVPEILIHIARNDMTGTLVLQRTGISKLVYFQKGSPVYVESNLRTENLGHFLVRRKKLTEARLEEFYSELVHGDTYYGALLIEKKWIEPASLATALVEHHEENLTNSFPWFDGTYEFVEGTDWPPTISLIPMRTYFLVFSGIMRWYDEPLVSAWMGLDEQATLKRRLMPGGEILLPPMVTHMLARISGPRSIRYLAERLRAPLAEVIPVAYGLIIAGWADLAFDRAAEVSQPEFKLPPKEDGKLKPELPGLLRRWIDEDFERFRNLNFYELLGVSESASDLEITRAHRMRIERYGTPEVQGVDDGAVREKTVQILSWLKLAHDTLRDPDLRAAYAERGRKPRGVERSERLETDRTLFACLRDRDGGNLAGALSGLTKASKKYPDDAAIAGNLGWVLFQTDRKANLTQASRLLARAIEGDPSDAALYFFRGEIFAYLGEWKRAEWHYAQAVRLHPDYVEARVGLEMARKRLS